VPRTMLSKEQIKAIADRAEGKELLEELHVMVNDKLDDFGQLFTQCLDNRGLEEVLKSQRTLEEKIAAFIKYLRDNRKLLGDDPNVKLAAAKVIAAGEVLLHKKMGD